MSSATAGAQRPDSGMLDAASAAGNSECQSGHAGQNASAGCHGLLRVTGTLLQRSDCEAAQPSEADILGTCCDVADFILNNLQPVFRSRP